MNLDSRQMRTVLLMLAAVIAILAILWFALLRTNYVPAYQNIREADASAIIAELDNASIPYRLANDGHDILVPEDMASEARVVVAGSNVSFGGSVGFELFNDSDMGLTEFAQKINFQRAMQGELSRTIMMMDGVDFARVHLAIPERSIFRAAQGSPTAAVTIEMLPGANLTSQRIGGVRQLVASSVPGLATFDVAVLDENGDLVSASAPTGATDTANPVSERGALENFYAVRARKAIADVLPGMPFDLELTARQREAAPAEEEGEVASEPARAVPGRGDLALRVMVRTPQELGSEERDMIQSALVDTLGLAESGGDVLSFTTGALSQAVAAPAPAPASAAAPATTEAEATSFTWNDGLGEMLISRWTLIMLALLAIAMLVVWPRRRLAKDDAESFAEMLKSASNERESLRHG
ncbi:flagellar basal-body MS-ring/collar protein FliF [Parerythrobacter jejuensis]|uniref:Flagellar M-ring protein FliF n=1 Tax=Parerythrobacter jejuensis TaxID=795812 RepID=A0A845AUR3_9SPHN|nr:flagellar basal-body MS-ring/collar protein FliF [Parerythrobacter jejuensis]MXP30568.1 flagellar M-ring protein FliF [Parerythrobacter jejuensis]MXP33328.1 flagellar M-ring protein FliF [Parerythrobacter jejuensis]